MKNLLLVFPIVFLANVLHAHPGLEPHAHDSVIGEWGWLMAPVLIIFVVGMILTKKKAWAKVKVK